MDVRDVVAELAERAQVISQEAGTKVSAAMKDVVSAAAGIAGFAIESARDLVQYMVRRGQMTPEEGERLIREAEAAHEKRSPGEKGKATASKLASERAAAKSRSGRALGRSPRGAIREAGLQDAGRRAVERPEILRGIERRAQDGAAPRSAGQERGIETSAYGEDQAREAGKGRQARQSDQAARRSESSQPRRARPVRSRRTESSNSNISFGEPTKNSADVGRAWSTGSTATVTDERARSRTARNMSSSVSSSPAHRIDAP